MKRNRWIIVLAVLGFFVFTAFIFVTIIGLFLPDKPTVKQDTVLEIALTGLVTERYPRDAISRQLQGANVQLHDIRKALHMAQFDERIRGAYVRLSSPDFGWAKARAIKQSLQAFKSSGKFVTAYLNFVDERSYYVALAADTIFAQPYSFALINGFAAEVPFVKRMLNKLGVEPQVHNIGKYKSAGDVLKRESMSPAHREATETILADVHREFVDKVCEIRRIDRDTLEAVLQRGMFQTNESVAAGLVDDLKHESEVLDYIKTHVYGDKLDEPEQKQLNTLDIRQYARLSPADIGIGGGKKIALIYALGQIMPGSSGNHPINGRMLGADTFIHSVRAAVRDKSIEAIVMRIDSPGGSGQASDQIWAEIEEARKQKPVVASMGDVAASGGYWIAMNSDAIVAEPLTMTGSIGVVSALFDLSETYDKLGIDWETVKTHAHADMPTSKRALTDSEWQEFKQMNRQFYDYFVQKVADEREMSREQVEEIAQGRVWTGKRAAQLGLVDTLGGLDAARKVAMDKAGIAQEEKTQWVVFPKPKGLLESIFERLQSKVAKAWLHNDKDWQFLSELPPQMRALMHQASLFSRTRNGEVLALEPFVPDVH